MGRRGKGREGVARSITLTSVGGREGEREGEGGEGGEGGERKGRACVLNKMLSGGAMFCEPKSSAEILLTANTTAHASKAACIRSTYAGSR